MWEVNAADAVPSAKYSLVRLAWDTMTNVGVIELTHAAHFNALSGALTNDLGEAIERPRPPAGRGRRFAGLQAGRVPLEEPFRGVTHRLCDEREEIRRG